MVRSASLGRVAGTPTDLHAIVQDAINRGDVDRYLDAHDDDAIVVVPLDGRVVRGRDEIRAAIAPLLACAPSMTMRVVRTLETPALALSHGRWRLTLTEHGSRAELSGLGTIVARRLPDDSWRIVLDDPLTGT